MNTAPEYLAGARLRARLAGQFELASQSGAVLPIRTRTEYVVSGGVPFVVRVVEALGRKPDGFRQTDPFSPPYEADLWVGAVSPTHVVLLNKFNVLDEHLLLITREYEDQENLLTPADFKAMLIGLAAVDGLAFHNGGSTAGASQPHKHLQLVPLPLAPKGPDLPVAASLEQAVRPGAEPAQAALPFRCLVEAVDPKWLQAPTDGAAAAHQAYCRLLSAAGLATRGPRQSAPYNLLMSRRWLWLVPRSRSGVEGIEVNALGFAGAMLARDEPARKRLMEIGPLPLLSQVALPA